MRRFFKTYQELFEDDAVSVSVPQPLIKDMEVVRDHCNANILKQYSSKIESFTYTGEGNNNIKFMGNSFPAKVLGVMGAVVEQARMIILLEIKENGANGPLILEVVYKSGNKKQFTIGKYTFDDGSILFNSVDEDGDLDGDEVAIGESEFAVSTSSVDINNNDFIDTDSN